MDNMSGTMEEKKDDKKQSDISIDELLQDLGEFGLWQWIGIVILWLPSMAGGIIVLTYSFAGTSSLRPPFQIFNLRIELKN